MIRASFLLVVLSLPLFASARGGGSEGTGGGDLCEDRFQEVRDDIKSWIDSGGPKGLDLAPGLTVGQYTQAMVPQIASAKVACVGRGDRGFPVMVEGTPKVCAFAKGHAGSQITCDFEKFQSMNASDQYVLVHHEYAGLAGLEPPAGDVSTYRISNQISGFLTEVQVPKLAIKPNPSNGDLWNTATLKLPIIVVYQRATDPQSQVIARMSQLKIRWRFAVGTGYFCYAYTATKTYPIGCALDKEFYPGFEIGIADWMNILTEQAQWSEPTLRDQYLSLYSHMQGGMPVQLKGDQLILEEPGDEVTTPDGATVFVTKQLKP